MNFSDKILRFYFELPSELPLPKDISLIYPFGDKEVRAAVSAFYRKYFSDQNERIYIFGINPGRFGAGITGIPFTDPQLLEDICGIENDWDKKNELSSIFVYDFINRMGGPDVFYSRFIISSLCPLGFLKEGKNYNYYDDKKLLNAARPFLIESIEKQLDINCDRRIAFSLGKGKNYKIFKELNETYSWFDEVKPLPHPRWVMQYQRKHLEKHMQTICLRLGDALA